MADLLTVSRIAVAMLMLLMPVDSAVFRLSYIWCGISDMLDGYIARRTHTVSEHGAALDSIADIALFCVCAVRWLPRIHLPGAVWAWIAGIAAVRILLLRKSPHSNANRMTGLVLFLYPFYAFLCNAALLPCMCATLALFYDSRCPR